MVFTMKKAADVFGDDFCCLDPYEVVEVQDDGDDGDGEVEE